MWPPVTRGGRGKKSWNSCDVIYGWSLGRKFLPWESNQRPSRSTSSKQRAWNCWYLINLYIIPCSFSYYFRQKSRLLLGSWQVSGPPLIHDGLLLSLVYVPPHRTHPFAHHDDSHTDLLVSMEMVAITLQNVLKLTLDGSAVRLSLFTCYIIYLLPH